MKEGNLSVRERHYQQEVFTTTLKWTLGAVPAAALMCLVAFLIRPVSATLVMGLVYFLFTPFVWWCLRLVQGREMQRAVRTFMGGGMTVQILYGLLAPESVFLLGAMALSLLVLLAVFLEPLDIAVRWGLVSILSYLVTLLLRPVIPWPRMDLGPFAGLFLYVVPVVVLSLTAVLGYIITKELRRALARSEAVRQDLARSYADAAIQTEALERSQQRLTDLAAKLERSNHELQTVNEELKSFAYIISHDLRTPLINLKGFAGELRTAVEVIQPVVQQACSEMDEGQRQAVLTALHEDMPEALSFIDVSVTRMEHFIKAILNLSRLGRRELDFEVIDMATLVETTVQTLAHRIEQRGVKVTVGPLPKVVADRVALEQIISNLLTNAVDYLDPDRPGEIEIRAASKQDETVFYVRDNGRGIAAEDMHKVFEPFRRIGKHDVPGEGMGLAYVQTLVRRHGGRIWCQSEIGKGTTFAFTLYKDLPQGGKNA